MAVDIESVQRNYSGLGGDDDSTIEQEYPGALRSFSYPRIARSHKELVCQNREIRREFGRQTQQNVFCAASDLLAGAAGS